MSWPATESRDQSGQSGTDAIFVGGGGGAWKGGKQGILAGPWEPFFSPLGVPTSAREDIDRVSIPNSLLNHEKLRKLEKKNRYS